MTSPRRAPIGDPLLRAMARPGSASPVEVVATKGGRRHAAKQARIGALVVSCATTAGLGAFFAGNDQRASGAAPRLRAPAVSTAGPIPSTVPAAVPAGTAAVGPTLPPAAPPGVAPAASPQNPAGPPAAPKRAGAGSFPGDEVWTQFGPVLVQAQVSGGKLVDVAVAEYPSDARRSQRINSVALPELRTEAIRAQSANIDTVSGATYTSEAYSQSLQSALDQARAAGAIA